MRPEKFHIENIQDKRKYKNQNDVSTDSLNDDSNAEKNIDSSDSTLTRTNRQQITRKDDTENSKSTQNEERQSFLSRFLFIRDRFISGSNTIGVVENSTPEDGARECLKNNRCESFDYVPSTKVCYLNEKQLFPFWGENSWVGSLESIENANFYILKSCFNQKVLEIVSRTKRLFFSDLKANNAHQLWYLIPEQDRPRRFFIASVSTGFVLDVPWEPDSNILTTYSIEIKSQRGWKEVCDPMLQQAVSGTQHNGAGSDVR